LAFLAAKGGIVMSPEQRRADEDEIKRAEGENASDTVERQREATEKQIQEAEKAVTAQREASEDEIKGAERDGQLGRATSRTPKE
jgi:hypothetical protein